MPTNDPKFYVSTPIYYVNDRPHIGHIYTTTLADVLARYHRLRGDRTFFLTGTDEHAAKVVDTAKEKGFTAQQWADQNAGVFQDTFKKLGMSNDDFIRTSQDRHTSRVKQYIQQLIESGDVYAGEYEGWYDAGQEEYLPENKAKEYDYRSPFNNKPLVRKVETNYFFKLSAYQDRLTELLNDHPQFVQPDARRNEVLGRIREGLNDVPISRSGSGGWGIAMPGDESQTVYVWIDALFNYYTTVDTDDRRAFWPADVHLIAKDILWFHAVIWPAMLMALDLPLPKQVYSHSFWISEGQKMSKSLGNFIDLEKIDEYVDEFSLDALRWYLSTQGPLGSTDSDFAHGKFVDVYNSDLANTLGNCAARVTNMIVRYFDGKMPAAAPGREDAEARQLRSVAMGMYEKVDTLYEKVAVAAANDAALEVVRAVDTFIEQTQPFKLAKDESQRERLGMILYYCAEALRIASLGLSPVLPDKMAEFWQLLGITYDTQAGDLADWCQWGGLQLGSDVQKGAPLFPRKQDK
ncbi:methionine--tRNA ligase [Planctomycetales bacterium ZRK34]|nr:methionine--tRNA ligase [Planctomycetales bacterium ZRK34]